MVDDTRSARRNRSVAGTYQTKKATPADRVAWSKCSIGGRCGQEHGCRSLWRGCVHDPGILPETPKVGLSVFGESSNGGSRLEASRGKAQSITRSCQTTVVEMRAVIEEEPLWEPGRIVAG